MSEDPSVKLEIDQQAFDYVNDQVNQLADTIVQDEEAKAQVAKQEQTEEEQAVAEQDDPRNAEKWGFKALVKEGQSIVSGGLQDTASSVTTFAERTKEALDGTMQREKEELGYYKPDWDPFVNQDNPIETKTWWGRQLRGLVHFGSLAAGVVLSAKGLAAAGIGGGISAGATKLLGASSFIRAAGIGAISDLISKESDGQNALGALRDRYGWFDTPLSTRDTDHPVVMKIKNIVEGMGIGLFFDGMTYAMGKGSQKVLKQIQDRNDSVSKQSIEAAVAQIREGEIQFRADKNSPVSQPYQGAHVSEVDPDVARQQLSRTRNEWGSEEGATGSVTTPVERERIALKGGTDVKQVERVLKGLMSSERFAKELKAAKGDRVKLAQTFKEAVDGHQAITQGRNAAELSANEYLKDLLEANKDIVDGVEVFTSKNVVVTDLVVGSLLKQLRDTGIAGREIADLVSLDDIDGPAKQIVDTMLTALYHTKKARFVKSDSFRALGAGKNRAKNIEDAVKADVADAKESIMSVLKIAKDDKNDDLLNALFEAFSMMKDVNTLDDFDNFARKMIKGGQLDPKSADRTGVMIRELEGVLTHSVLSGPKTPLRAITGTSIATFLRPMATTLGAAMRYPFKGDSATVRAGLASMNAMIEAIPESFTLFRERLNSYWKGDIASIKTRYSEFTRGDENWELIRRWAEDSGRADFGDRAAFAIANMARSMNNSNLLTYSTKIMAATDDAFAYIIGRAKMREKALRNVLDLQAADGIKLPEITPEVLKAYEDDFYAQIFDSQGNIVDEATKFARREVTLTQELTGFAKGLNDVFSANPWAKPFFLFARTGVNGLALTAKHTPGFNFLVKEFNDIAFATPSNLKNVERYGITNAVELANAKALQTGRLAMGSALVFMASMAWMRGDLTGNGPVDRQKRRMWLDGKWEPRTIKLGAVRVGYDTFEPFNLIMSTIADVGDASLLMGEEWTERELQKISLVVAQAITSKSYLAGIQSFVDLFGGRPGQFDRIIAGLVNNSVPLAGLRNELGKLFVPYMREIGSGIDQSLRNRNLISETLTSEQLPIKYDMLNGKPINNWDFLTRAFNMFSPVTLTLEQSEGRQFLFNSGYDLRLSTYYAPDSTNLTDTPRIRSLFQKAIGDQNIELELNKLAKDPKAIASLELMRKDIRDGKRAQYDARNYWHNGKIDQIFQEARRKAWASIMEMPEVAEVIAEQKEAKRQKYLKKVQSNDLLNIYK